MHPPCEFAVDVGQNELIIGQSGRRHRSKTPEQKSDAKEANLKKANGLVAFLENEELKKTAHEAEQPATPLVLFVCNHKYCPLKSTPHSGPYTTFPLCRARDALKPSRHDKEKNCAYCKKSRRQAKKAKIDASSQGQPRLPFNA